MRQLIYTLLATILCSCSERPSHVRLIDTLPPIFPDYTEVTIPVGIAPLNFCIANVDIVDAEIKGENGDIIVANGKWADFDIDEWHQLLEKNIGRALTVSVSTKKDGQWSRYNDFKINISRDSLNDFGVAYRKLAPGYETFSHIGIYQRDIHTFTEYPIVESTAAPGECINCHAFRGTEPDRFNLHFRGLHGGTMIQIDGKRRWLDTRNDSTLSNCMYPYWHPTGNYCAYSLNLVHQCFFVKGNRPIEVFDRGSDATILDIRTNQLIQAPCFTTEDFETYPVFSADGRTIYYCTSKPHNVPAEYEQMRYDLCKVSFDPDNGTIGNKVDTILKVSDKGKCVSFPMPSHDGRYIMYCLADCGVFPINHKEADLWLMDLATGQQRCLEEVNSDDTESYHSWSTNSRWFVFSSRRGDGLYSKLYFANIDANGNVGKPFLMPQRNPQKYYDECYYTFNVPEIVKTKVEYDVKAAFDEQFSNKRETVSLKKIK